MSWEQSCHRVLVLYDCLVDNIEIVVKTMILHLTTSSPSYSHPSLSIVMMSMMYLKMMIIIKSLTFVEQEETNQDCLYVCKPTVADRR